MDFSALLIKIFIFMVLLATGYLMANKGLLGGGFAKSASTLLLDVFITASIINAVLGERPAIGSSELWKVMLILTLTTLVGYVIAFLAGLFSKKGEKTAQMELLIEVPNTLFVGLPIVQALYGSEAAFYVGISCVPFNVILFTYGVWKLKRAKAAGNRLNFKDILSPAIIASIIATVIFVSGVSVPRVLKELFGTVSGATVPFSMIVIGATLGNVSILEAFKGKEVWFISFLRLIIAPLAAYVLVGLFTDNQVLLLTCMVLAGCPCGTICTPLSIQYGFDPEFSSHLILVTTILSMLILPLFCVLLF